MCKLRIRAKPWAKYPCPPICQGIHWIQGLSREKEGQSEEKKTKKTTKKSNKEATKSKRKGILELQDQKQIWKELSEASHAEVLNVCTWEDERAQTSPLSLGSLLMPVRDRGCSTRRFSLVLHMFLSAMGIYLSIQTWESGLLVVTAAEMQNLRYTGFYFPSFILG